MHQSHMELCQSLHLVLSVKCDRLSAVEDFAKEPALPVFVARLSISDVSPPTWKRLAQH